VILDCCTSNFIGLFGW